VILVKEPDIDVPEPLAGIPVMLVVLFLVQEKAVPGTLLGLVISIWVIGLPEQIVCGVGVALTVGVGLTVIVAVIEE